MGRVFGFVGLLLVLATGMYIYKQQILATSSPGATSSPRGTVDITGVRSDLIAIASAERRRFATDGKYAEIEDLISNGDISMQTPTRGPFSYSSSVSTTGFKITATYGGNDPGIPKTLSIDDSMQIASE
jgi:hypothetical protein